MSNKSVIQANNVDIQDLINKVKALPSLGEATITPADVGYGEIAYGKDGRIVGSSPIVHVEGDPLECVLPSSHYWFACYGNGMFVMSSSGTGGIIYSHDGSHWYSTSYKDSSATICYGKDKFVVLYGSVIRYSYNGIDWSEVENPISDRWQSICYSEDLDMFVATVSNSDIVAYSIDGINWSQSTLPASGSWYVGSGNGMFVAIKTRSTIAAYSIDGINWTQSTGPYTTYLKDICYAKGMFIALGYASSSFDYSTDGIRWGYRKFPISGGWQSICYSEDLDMFVVVSNSQTALYSKDGVNWTEMQLPVSSEGCYSVCYGNGKFVVGPLMSDVSTYSVDGINWQSTSYGGEIVNNLPGGVTLSYADMGPRKLVLSDTELKFEGDYTTADATIEPKEVLKNEVAYGVEGKIVGEAPLSFAGEKTILATLPVADTWNAVCYGDGRYVAVSDTMIAYSLDGITWGKVADSYDGYFSNICYGGGIFAILYTNGTVLYSTDAKTWNTSRVYAYGSDPSNGCLDIIYDETNSSFIVWSNWGFAGSSSDFVTFSSSDASTWELDTDEYPIGLSDICFDGELVMMIGLGDTVADIQGLEIVSGTGYSDGKIICCYKGKGVVAYSDGITGGACYSVDGYNTWYDIEALNGYDIVDIVYVNDKFIAILSNSASIAYSADVINWTFSVVPVPIMSDICHDGDKYIAVGSGTEMAKFSTDLVNWSSEVVKDIYKLEDTSNGMNIAAEGCDERHLVVETKRGEWTESTIPLADWYSVTYGNGMFVAIANRSTSAAYSTDGITWSESTLPRAAEWHSVAYGNSMFVAIAYGSNKAAYSTDGINWTQSTMPAPTKWNSVCYGNSMFVAIAYGSNKAAYSTDGINWTQSTLPASDGWYSVTYGNGMFVAIANNSNKVAYSTDGITWTQSTLPASVKWYFVCYGNGKFVAVAQGSDVSAYSTDGINWTSITLPASEDWYSVCYGDGMFVAVAMDSSIAVYSIDGINWAQMAMASEGNFIAVCYGSDRFVAVANSSDIVNYKIYNKTLRFEDEVDIDIDAILEAMY